MLKTIPSCRQIKIKTYEVISTGIILLKLKLDVRLTFKALLVFQKAFSEEKTSFNLTVKRFTILTYELTYSTNSFINTYIKISMINLINSLFYVPKITRIFWNIVFSLQSLAVVRVATFER